MANRTEGGEAAEAKGAAPAAGAPAAGGEAAAPAKSGGLGGWLPLIATVVLMPVLAFVTTQFILLPKLRQASGAAPAAEAAHGEEKHDAPADEHGKPAAKEGGEHGAKSGGSEHGAKGGGKGKFMDNSSLNKMLVNVSGTMGTRYLMTSVTLVGNSAEMKSLIEENKDQLKDVALSTLGLKTISDLERPGARNLIRAELISVLNNVLGGNYIQDIYITELAIQ